ncbi:MAG: four helix bundle protein [Armatimonadetes bacterium]|nr:four helix bundle protein [Armatimonadota bacterium]
MDLVMACYQLCREFPKEELYSLNQQIQRAAVSMPANIAGGYRRGSRKEYLQFLSVARGSLMELETHLLISERPHFSPRDSVMQVLSLTDEIGRMLNALIRKLREGVG